MRQRTPHSSRFRVLLAVVLFVSLILLLLPSSWRGPLRGLVQLLLPFQHAATIVGDSIADRTTSETNPDRAAEDGLPLLSREAWEHRTASLSLRIQELENDVQLLTATRLWDVDGRRMGSSGRLIPARAVAGDVVPWRDSLLLSSGRLQGVRQGSVVVTDRFTIDRGEAIGLREGMAVLLGETLVGWVEELHLEAARVTGVSDPSVEMKAKIGRVTETGFESVDGFFWLEGRGRGRIEIREVDQRLVQSGAMRIGDLVVSDPASPFLAFPMVIGRVSEIVPNRENPLFSVVTVRTAFDGQPLRRVYVFDPQAEDDH